jgi:uncharacterized protein DUF6744
MRDGEFIVLKDETKGAGAATFWTLSGDLDLPALTEKWEATGLPKEWLPDTRGPEVAFGRALATLEQGDLFVERVRSTKERALVFKSEIEGTLSYETLAKWKLGDSGVEQTFALDAASRSLHEIVQEAFERELNRVNANDVSGWLTRLACGRLDAVALRDTGGFYYVPPAHVETWSKIKQLLREISGHVVYVLPMMKSEATVEAVLAACLNEAGAEIARLEAVLQANAAGGGELGERALASKATKAEALRDQMARYEKLLEVKMPDITQKLETLRANLFAASAQAAAEKESEKQAA